MNNNNKKRIVRDPFNYFVIDDFLKDDIYKKLKREFYEVIDSEDEWTEEFGLTYEPNGPKVTHKLNSPILYLGSGQITDSFTTIKNLFVNKPYFSDFLSTLNYEKTFNEILHPFKLKKKIKVRKTGERIGLIQKILYENCRVSLKISRILPGSGIAIHPDNYPKAVSLLLHFGFSDNQSRLVGGTQIYKRKKGFQSRHHRHFYHPNFKKIDDIHPLENRLVGFIKSPESWHGVDPESFAEESEISRDTLQINLMSCTQYKGLAYILSAIKVYLGKIFS